MRTAYPGEADDALLSNCTVDPVLWFASAVRRNAMFCVAVPGQSRL